MSPDRNDDTVMQPVIRMMIKCFPTVLSRLTNNQPSSANGGVVQSPLPSERGCDQVPVQNHTRIASPPSGPSPPKAGGFKPLLDREPAPPGDLIPR